MGGQTAPAPLLLLILGWSLYYLLHSLLAATAVKRIGERRLGVLGYRRVYVLVAVAGLGALLWWTSRWPAASNSPWWQGFGMVVLAGSGWLMLAGLRSYSLRGFLGLGAEPGGHLVTGGVHRIWRHPLYSATYLLLVGLLCLEWSPRTWVVAGTTGLYLWLGTLLEERKLLATHGDRYQAHLQRGRRFLPARHSRRV